MAVRKRSIRADWEDLRVLIELARLGSLSATARALGITHATVSRRIASLEASLCQQLVMRDGGRYVLTDAGTRILAAAAPMAASADAVLRAATGFGELLTGAVRITATEMVAKFLVLPAIEEILGRFPGIEVYLNVTQANLNLARSDADIAIRLAKPAPDSGLVASKVNELTYHLYGSRSYVESRRPEQLQFIGYPAEVADWPESKMIDNHAAGRKIALRMNHLGNRIEAARLGMGIALLPSLMAEEYADLVRISRGSPVMRRDVFVILHEDNLEVPRMKACVQVLTETIRKNIPVRG
jgi:molybdate transport repressor ModE-like protein